MWVLEIERAFPEFKRQFFERLDCKPTLMPWGSVLVAMYAVGKGMPTEPILWAFCDRKNEFDFVVRVGARVKGRRGLTIRVERELTDRHPLNALVPVVQEIEDQIRTFDAVEQWVREIEAAYAEVEGVVFHDRL